MDDSIPDGRQHPFSFDEKAATYDVHRAPGGPFVPALASLAEEAKAKCVLEIGCGTGNSASALFGQRPCPIVGIDLSIPMLRQAKAKNAPLRMIQADGTRLPLANQSVDFIFGVLVLHLIEDMSALFDECRRVLGEGAAAFVTAPQSFIENHFLNEYFPSFAKIDRARFQSEEAVCDAMARAGFSRIQTKLTKREPVPVNTAYVDRVANKFISTLELIPDDEFAAGLARLRADVERKGRLDRPMEWEAVVISGWV